MSEPVQQEPTPDEVLEQQRLNEAFRRCFTGPEGDLVMAELADVCHFKAPTLNPTADGGFDPIGMAHREGQRYVYLEILARIESAVTAARATDEDTAPEQAEM